MEVYQARDGFVGSVIGDYVTREGVAGKVLQQIGTRVVHVYRCTALERYSPAVIRVETIA
jgi:hypothetical protein